MIEEILVFLVVLFVAAALLRDDFAFTILYLFAGIYIVGRWWSGRAVKAIRIFRDFTPRAFLGDDVKVRLEIRNTGILPVPWLRVQDSLPIELAAPGLFKRVLSMGSRGKEEFEYVLKTRKRGYYPIGPLVASSGDLFGLGVENRLEGGLSHLTVYPKIYILSKLELPSRSPMGTLRHKQPIFEDPTRVLSKRDYVAGDSLRRVDWKATAITGRLQVKQFEPSIALETAIFLNLNLNEYDLRARFDATELAIIIAASIANRVIDQKQALGLNTNGLDPLSNLQRFRPLPIRRGQGHLMHILDVLARIEAAETLPFLDMLRQEIVHLPWGSTLVLVTGSAEETLFDGLFQIRRSGLNAVLVLAGQIAHTQRIRQRAEYFKFPFYNIRTEFDLDMWRS
jgi:uncharacterized protein (DUF58 family)